MNVLECKNLYKSYGTGRYVLENMSLALPAGRIVGLLGPDGCGKSTLMKTVAGLLMPDSGAVSVAGTPVGEETKTLVSYLPERTYFNSWMRVGDLVEYFADFYRDFDSGKAKGLLSDLHIDPSARLKSLSKGTKEKVQLILVMSRRARLYLLDEPIAGVDPAAREYILSTIVGNYDPDSTILITTHLIADVEPVLDEFLFMGYSGKILRAGTADAVREETGMSLDALFREVFRCSANC